MVEKLVPDFWDTTEPAELRSHFPAHNEDAKCGKRQYGKYPPTHIFDLSKLLYFGLIYTGMPSVFIGRHAHAFCRWNNERIPQGFNLLRKMVGTGLCLVKIYLCCLGPIIHLDMLYTLDLLHRTFNNACTRGAVHSFNPVRLVVAHAICASVGTRRGFLVSPSQCFLI